MGTILMRTSICALALYLVASMQAFAGQDVQYKVAVLEYMQETCTFCPGGDTTIADRTRRVPYVSGEDLLKRAGGFVGGFMHAAAQFDAMKVVGLNSPDDVFGGSSRSWESKQSFEHFMKIIIDDLEAQMPVQGVYLSLPEG
jgi:microcystin degradation protein MlrC